MDKLHRKTTIRGRPMKPLECHVICDVCGTSRARGTHKRCSKIRQERHAQMIRNEELDRMLMFDKKDGGNDSPIPIPSIDAYAD